MADRATFDRAFLMFFEGCERIASDHTRKNFSNLTPDAFSFTEGVKRIRVVRRGSVHCFVDIETGDVLRAAGWAKPAKHARGNIYDASNGLGKMGPYGPAYLR